MEKNIFKLDNEQLKAIVCSFRDKTEEGLKTENAEIQCIPTFITPARIITHIGFIFTFRSNIMQTAKISTRLHFVPVTAIRSLLPQNAVIRIEIPAAAIIATTAGLKDPSTPCNTSILRYFKYSFAMTVTIIQEGRMHPNVAARAPGIPAILIPTKVADFTSIGH